MTLELRPLAIDQLYAASQLCLRSKGYWGYDEEFLEACKVELTITASDLLSDPIVVAVDSSGLAGVAQVSNNQTGCYLEKLFVDTDLIGNGVGKLLFVWAINTARKLGAHEIIIDADPDAVPFYERMGCISVGQVPSESVVGRFLPRLVLLILLQ